ncbi:Crp/Fnr family transcriptional regulator [Roseiarcus sp.]|uniref:Crp/Fnr family transcriptional regulator n=1 Tax=Roseiarcus sp. TaxID=1969460 RepID=UPI003F97BD24
MSLDADVARLARTRPFSLMPREAVQLIAFSCVKQRLRAGESLFHAGDEGDAGYFIQSGAILLEDKSAVSASRRATAGALVGESALYAPAVRRVDARADEDTVLTRIPRETFRRVLSEFPEAAQKVRAALAERTRRLVDGLDAARARSIDAAPLRPRVPT